MSVSGKRRCPARRPDDLRPWRTGGQPPLGARVGCCLQGTATTMVETMAADIDEALAILERVTGTAPLAGSRIHGEQHWQAVARIGLRLAGATCGADERIALLFAILHDARR